MSLFDRYFKGRVVPAMMRLNGSDQTQPAVWHAPDERDYQLKRVIAGNVQHEVREDEAGNFKKYEIRTFVVERFPEAFMASTAWTNRQREAHRGYILYDESRWAVEEIEAQTGSLVRFRTCKITYHERTRQGFRTAV